MFGLQLILGVGTGLPEKENWKRYLWELLRSKQTDKVRKEEKLEILRKMLQELWRN